MIGMVVLAAWLAQSGALVRAADAPATAAKPARDNAADGKDQTEPPQTEQPVDYARQIRPILSKRCWTCHGPDENTREVGLRLDTRQGATEWAIVPGDAESSAVVDRIAETDPDYRMPPPASKKKPLTPDEIELVRRWIDQGAKFDQHWAYQKPVRPDPPKLDEAAQAWARNAIDHFTAAVHRREDVKPAPEADRRTLIRRLSLDLTGIPPALEEVEAFVADESPEAYERLVDRLLASPRYGERMAVFWLDVARYADTGGYHSDNHRDVWLYRDYVIRAFNENRPFDQFTIEQLAGDLLPEPTRWQKIASGYNRLLLTTEEGGAQPKEYTAKYSADRSRNAATAWLGSTLGCAECHDHKYDPFTQKDFYRFAAFFADVKQKAVGRQTQTPMPTKEQAAELAQLEGAMAPLRKKLATHTPALHAAQQAWEEELKRRSVEWAVLTPKRATAKGGATLEIGPDGSILAKGPNPDNDTYSIEVELPLPKMAALRLEVLPHDSLPGKGPGRAGNGNFVVKELELKAAEKRVAVGSVTATHSQKNFEVAGAADGNPKTGWAILDQTGKPNEALFELAEDLPGEGTKGEATKLIVLIHFDHPAGHALGHFRLSATAADRPVRAGAPSGLPKPLHDILVIDAGDRTEEQKQQLAEHYRSIAPALEATRAELAKLEKQKQELQQQIPTTLITELVEPRVVRLLPRGNWMDDSGPVMEPGVPAFLGSVDVGDRRATRLDLARWLIDRENPLVARTLVNRIWGLLFGQGIVRSADDLGTQGDLPTHPKLLDWLAVEMIESGWDVKRMVRLIVTSATYRQSSDGGEALRRRDPANLVLARQGSFRLDAEFIRDNALAVSGLLVEKLGGPSVKPYQPAGYWSHLNFPRRTYRADTGDDQYRRGLYTYWQRTFLHPSLLAFDAPSREECVAKRSRSNTPLQSLVLLNDPTYVEAARALATRGLREAGGNDAERIDYLVRQTLGRAPRPVELDELSALVDRHRRQYANDEAAAKKLLAAGQSLPPSDIPAAELAAWTSAARVVLNLHETITRY